MDLFLDMKDHKKGRYRQFHQFGAEYIGVEGFEADVEIVLLADFIWKKIKN